MGLVSSVFTASCAKNVALKPSQPLYAPSLSVTSTLLLRNERGSPCSRNDISYVPQDVRNESGASLQGKSASGHASTARPEIGNCVQKPKDITTAGMAGGCPVCSETVDVFLDIIGAEAGAMALRSMATGGVYIAGGIPVRLMDRITQGNMRSAYLNPASRFSKVTSRFPLYVLTKEVGLKGVFNFAMSLAKRAVGAPSAGARSAPSSSASSSSSLP